MASCLLKPQRSLLFIVSLISSIHYVFTRGDRWWSLVIWYDYDDYGFLGSTHMGQGVQPCSHIEALFRSTWLACRVSGSETKDYKTGASDNDGVSLSFLLPLLHVYLFIIVIFDSAFTYWTGSIFTPFRFEKFFIQLKITLHDHSFNYF